MAVKTPNAAFLSSSLLAAMKEPLLVPPGRCRWSSSAGGLTLPLVSTFQAAARGGSAAVPSAVSQQLRSLGLPLAAASGVVLLLFCLFASTSTTTSRSSSRGFGSTSERAALSSLPGGNEAASARFRLPNVDADGGVVDGAASSSAALRLRGSGNSSPSSPLPPPPFPTLSPEDEAAFEADLISMLAGEGGGGKEDEGGGGGGGDERKNGGGGATASTSSSSATTAASSSAAAAAASDSTNSGGIGGAISSSFSAAGSVVVKEGSSSSSSSELSPQQPRLFSAGKGGESDGDDEAATTATIGRAASSSSASSSSGTSALPGLPPDFDWRLYLAYNPDLSASGASDAGSAAAHFLARGREEGRPASRLRVALRYTACTGLINQHYSHVAALSLASVLGAEASGRGEREREREVDFSSKESSKKSPQKTSQIQKKKVVLPPAAQRDSFAHYFSTFADRNEVSWTAAPLETLLDVQALIRTWRQRPPGLDLTLRPPPSTSPFPDLTKPGTAYPAYARAPGGLQKEQERENPLPDPSTVAKVGDVYLRNLDMGSLVEKVRAAAVGKAIALRRAQLATANGSSSSSSSSSAAAATAAATATAAAALPPLPLITVDLPCAFFMLRTADSRDVVTVK